MTDVAPVIAYGWECDLSNAAIVTPVEWGPCSNFNGLTSLLACWQVDKVLSGTFGHHAEGGVRCLTWIQCVKPMTLNWQVLAVWWP